MIIVFTDTEDKRNWESMFGRFLLHSKCNKISKVSKRDNLQDFVSEYLISQFLVFHLLSNIRSANLTI